MCQCPSYTQETSYGIEWVECQNEDCPEMETWNGFNRQITAPKGTFDRIWNEAIE